MSPRAFNRIMLDMGVGTNRKVRRLTVPERWTFVAGVIPLAAQSPIRGALLIATSIPVTPQDVAEQAGVSVAVAKKTLGHMRTLGMLERDDELGIEWVHDFDDWQAEPRHDPTGSLRQKRYRDRQKQTSRRDVTEPVTGDVTGDVNNGGEVEVEEKNPPTPQGASVDPDRIDQAQQRVKKEAIQRVFDAWIEATGKTGRTLLDDKRRRLIRRALDRYPVEDVLDAVRGWRRSPHHRGENDSSTTYNDLGLLLRDGEHIERFRDLERSAPGPTNGRGRGSIDDVIAAHERFEREQEAKRAERARQELSA